MKITLRNWLRQVHDRFDSRELDYMSVQAAVIRLQIKDQETGRIELHEVTFTGKDAQPLAIVHEPGGVRG